MTTGVHSDLTSAPPLERERRGPSTPEVRAADRATALLGRLLYALPFAVFGILHFMNAGAMARLVPVPGGVFWIYFTGAAMLCGAIGIVSGFLGKWAAYGIALLMLLFVVFVHIPGLSVPDLRQMAMQGLLKDTALLGGALGWAVYFSERSDRLGEIATR